MEIIKTVTDVSRRRLPLFVVCPPRSQGGLVGQADSDGNWTCHIAYNYLCLPLHRSSGGSEASSGKHMANHHGGRLFSPYKMRRASDAMFDYYLFCDD